MSIWSRIEAANRPGPPEHSRSFRLASAAAVIVATAACWSQGALTARVTLFTIVATLVGNWWSYLRRNHPWGGVKILLAFCAVAGFAWFALTVAHHATPGDISTVEAPLATLFAWVLSTHAFDVPSRKDVGYSLAGSVALMAIAAAQAIDLSLAIYVVVWLATGIWGLVAMWQSVSETTTIPWKALVAALLGVAIIAVGLVSVLPAPEASTSLSFPSSNGSSSPLGSPAGLTDGSASLPAKAANPSGRTGVGGYLGFAKSLDTGVRATLSDQVVMRVRADRPSYWVGETFDHWDGQSWSNSVNRVSGDGTAKVETGSPFSVPITPDQLALAADNTPDVQTFYLAQSGPNLVFHADTAERVFMAARAIFLTGGGTIVSSSSMGNGTIYTVVSRDSTGTAQQLEHATATAPAGDTLASYSPNEAVRDLQLPHPYPRVAALAQEITAHVPESATDPHTYQKVEAIEAWMSSHVHYTTDIPPLAPGQDAVSSFLFGSRLGYCEQISTATVVMLRSLGIPARETVGYVPGSYDPITDLYEVQAKDAHAWVQVWFPGYGWQNFDPTANVPLANPSPGSVIATTIGHALAHLPWIPIVVVVVLVTATLLVGRHRRNRPATWAHQIAADLARGGKRLGLPRRPSETLSAYGARLATFAPEAADDLEAATMAVERAVYGGVEPSAERIGHLTRATHKFATSRPKGQSQGEYEGGQALERASASSKDAPAASSGR